MAKLDDLKFGIKEVVMLIGWVLSMAGMYYTMNGTIKEQGIQLRAMQMQIDGTVGKYNLELLTYKLNEVNAKTDRVLHILNDGQ